MKTTFTFLFTDPFILLLDFIESVTANAPEKDLSKRFTPLNISDSLTDRSYFGLSNDYNPFFIYR